MIRLTREQATEVVSRLSQKTDRTPEETKQLQEALKVLANNWREIND